jgi:hypothetical protein
MKTMMMCAIIITDVYFKKMQWTRQRRTDEVETKLETPMVRLTGVNCYCLSTTITFIILIGN